MEKRFKVVVAGAGGIGAAVALLLREWGDFFVDIYLGDRSIDIAKEAVRWVVDASPHIPGIVEPFLLAETGFNEEFVKVLEIGEVVLDCLPGSQAPRIAKAAREFNLHYANLTEYVVKNREVMEIAKGADTGFILQTGLAPGYINVLGHKLFLDFCNTFGVEKVESLKMRVGALSRNAFPPTYYGFTWSPVGVATEYLEDAVVIRNWKQTYLASLTEIERVIILGSEYEEGLTSGGAADLPYALEGKVKNLDYKTLRHPGHFGWVKKVIESIPAQKNKVKELQRIMEKEIPAVEDDQVVIFSAAEGTDKNGIRRRIEHSKIVPPIKIGSAYLRAIQVTTAAGIAECCRMLLLDNLKGVILQSQIDPDRFLNGPFIKRGYRHRAVDFEPLV